MSDFITNKKETAAAIKAAVNQAKKTRPIEYTIKKGNSVKLKVNVLECLPVHFDRQTLKKRIDAYWKKQKENKWLK